MDMREIRPDAIVEAHMILSAAHQELLRLRARVKVLEKENKELKQQVNAAKADKMAEAEAKG